MIWAHVPIYLRISSANAEEYRNALIELSPDIVVVNGTRILSKELLTCCDVTFINLHAGITPKYIHIQYPFLPIER